MPAKTRAKPDTDTRILQTLGRVGPADAKTIAEQSSVAYSTVTAKLRDLMLRGKVTRQDGEDGPALWRATGDDAASKQAGSKQAGKPASPASGSSKPATKSGRRATKTADAAKASPATVPKNGDGRSNRPVTAAGRTRRAKRQLRGELLEFLRAHPDNAYKVSELSKALGGASAGAVANAAHKLVHTGTARQTVSAPATFQAS